MVLSPKGEKNHGKHVFYQFTIYLPYISIINPLSKNGCALFSDAVIANSEDRQPPGKPPRNEIAEENVTLLRDVMEVPCSGCFTNSGARDNFQEMIL